LMNTRVNGIDCIKYRVRAQGSDSWSIYHDGYYGAGHHFMTGPALDLINYLFKNKVCLMPKK
jgi:hypothetical protein